MRAQDRNLSLPLPCGFYPNAPRPHGLHLSQVRSTSLKRANFAGQFAVPHDHIPQTEDPLTGFTAWIFRLLICATRHLCDGDELEEAVGMGSFPSGTGRHPRRRCLRTLWRAISSETPDALSYVSGMLDPFDHRPSLSRSSTEHCSRERSCCPDSMRKCRKLCGVKRIESSTLRPMQAFGATR